MEASYIQSRHKWLINDSRISGEFNDMTLGIAFGDATSESHRHHSVCCAGLREDGLIFIFTGYSGYFNEMVNFAIKTKDEFRVFHGYIPSKPQTLVTKLRQTEGLTFYEQTKDPQTGKRKYTTTKDAWPSFVSHDQRVVLIPVYVEYENEFEGVLIDFEEKVEKGAILVPKTIWPDLSKVLLRPARDSLDDSILRSAVYATMPMLRHARTYNATTSKIRRYGNMPRRPKNVY